MKKSLLLKISSLIASGLASGYSRKAPGTTGSLAFLAIWLLLLKDQSFLFNLTFFLIITIIGWISTETILKFKKDLKKDKKGKIDPQWIVIDEWAGLYLALLFVNTSSIYQIAIAFILFRFFDASKLPPVNYAERLPGSHGIMLDDLVAGGISGLVLLLILISKSLII